MKMLRVVILTLLVALLAAAPAAAQTDFKSLMRKTLDAWETKDPSKAAVFYAKDAGNTYYDIAPLKYTGWDAYATGVVPILAGHESLKFTLNDDVQAVQRGNSAWGTATFRLDAVMVGGAKETMEGRWTVVWEKRGKEWLIVHEHVSFPFELPPSGPQSLYKRLGGYDAIAAVSDDFLGRLASDAQLGKFFQGVSKAHVQSIRQHVVDFLCAATGGPCVYVGRDMKSTHAGLGITEADWTHMVGLLIQTFDKFKVPDRERKEVLGALGPLKADIVDKK